MGITTGVSSFVVADEFDATGALLITVSVDVPTLDWKSRADVVVYEAVIVSVCGEVPAGSVYTALAAPADTLPLTGDPTGVPLLVATENWTDPEFTVAEGLATLALNVTDCALALELTVAF